MKNLFVENIFRITNLHTRKLHLSEMSLFYLSTTEEIEFIQRIRKKKKKKKRCFRCTNYKYSLKFFFFLLSFFKRFKLQRVPRELHLLAMSFFFFLFFFFCHGRGDQSDFAPLIDRDLSCLNVSMGLIGENVWRIDPRKRGKKNTILSNASSFPGTLLCTGHLKICWRILHRHEYWLWIGTPWFLIR